MGNVTEPSKKLTSTSLSTFGLCQTKYYWGYERRLRRTHEVEGEALTVGIAFHIGMDADDVDDGLKKVDAEFDRTSSAILDDDWFKQDALRAKVRAMVMRSWERWPDRPEMQETIFHCDLLGPEGEPSGFEFDGKIDGVAAGEVHDYKSLAKAVEYFAKNRLSYQPTGYLWALGKNGHDVDRIIFRLIERPTIRRKTGGKKGTPESADEYEERCLEWLDEPGHLAEEEFFFTDAKGRAFEEHLWLITRQILFVRESGAWMRNPHACRTWHRDCEYMPLCVQVADGTPLAQVHTDGYEVSDPHPELTTISDFVDPSEFADKAPF